MRPGDRTVRLVLLLVHAVTVQIISYAMRPAISYGLLEIGGGGGWIGVATAAFAVPPLILAVPAGRLADRLGERVPLVMGGLSFLAACLLALFAGGAIWGLVLATALLGLGVLFSVVGEQTWVMRDAGRGRLDNVFGLYTFATSSGQMLGPLLLMQPGRQDSPELAPVMIACLCVAAACFGLSFAVRPTLERGGSPAPAERMLPEAWRLLRRRGVPQALIASSLTLTSLDILLVYLPLLAQERMLAPAVLAVLLTVRGLATMGSRLLLGLLTSRFGRRRVLIWATAGAALAMIACAAPVPVWALLLACAVYGFAAGAVQPLTMSWMTLVTPREIRGVGASMRLVGNRAGQTAIPLAVAGLSVVSGAAAVFIATGASLFIAAGLSRAAPEDDAEDG